MARGTGRENGGSPARTAFAPASTMIEATVSVEPRRQMDVRCIVKSDDQLGEGPCWSPFEGRLYWFDIKGRRLAWYEPKTDARGAFDLPFRASAGAPRAQGGLIMATDRGLVFCDPIRGTLEVARPYQ